jgi:hypothetical protein
VNLARIQIVQPLVRSVALEPAGRFPLPMLSGDKLAGFLSLLDGLFDQYDGGITEPAIAASQPAEPPDAALLPRAANSKEKGQKIGGLSDAKLETAIFQLVSPGASGEMPFLIQTAEVPHVPRAGEGLTVQPFDKTQASTTTSQPQPLALDNFRALGLASEESIPGNVPLGSTRDVAFVLRLSSHPPATEKVQGRSGPPVTLVRSSSIHTPNRTDTPAGASESTGPVDAENPDSLIQDDPAQVAKEALRRRGEPAFLTIGNRTGQDAAGLRVTTVPAGIRPWNVRADSQPQKREGTSSPSVLATPNSKIRPCLVASGFPAQVDSEPQEFTGPAAPVLERRTVEWQAPTPSEDFPAPAPGIQAATPTSQPRDSEENRSTEPSASPHMLGAMRSSPIVGQGTSLNDAGTATGRDPGNPDCNTKPSRILPMEKSPRIQSIHEHADPATDEGTLGRPTEPSNAFSTRTKISPQILSAPTASPEAETDNITPSQPIREISLRLATAAAAHVDVLVAERAGKVQVAVRTGDPDLTKSLQSNLGDLLGRLEEKGFKTEAWTPATVQRDAAAGGERSNSANLSSHSEDSGSPSGQADQRHRESNQRRRGGRQAQFQDRLAAPIASTDSEKP